jgi:hypothetical protein
VVISPTPPNPKALDEQILAVKQVPCPAGDQMHAIASAVAGVRHFWYNFQ